MSPGKVSKKVIADRVAWINGMLEEISSLPLESYKIFVSDKRNIWSVESCLTRCLEGLMDLGRHILAKGFGRGTSEYKEIASGLAEVGVLSDAESEKLRILAGYRNRMVHFYHEVSHKELYEICTHQFSDITHVTGCIRGWLTAHPEMIDETL